MRFTVDGQQYQVVWNYDRIWTDTWPHRDAGDAPHNVRETRCWVNEYETPNFEGAVRVVHKLCVGVAHCSEQDAFVRKIGRKLALTRALKSMPREFRRQAWAAYLEMQGGQW